MYPSLVRMSLIKTSWLLLGSIIFSSKLEVVVAVEVGHQKLLQVAFHDDPKHFFCFLLVVLDLFSLFLDRKLPLLRGGFKAAT